MSRMLFTLVFVFFLLPAYAQHDTASVSFPADQLKGTWESLDSTKQKISFIEQAPELVLKFATGLNYYFAKDSSGNIVNTGVIIQWPPFYCLIRKVAEREIELLFYDHTGTQMNKMHFRKRE